MKFEIFTVSFVSLLVMNACAGQTNENDGISTSTNGDLQAKAQKNDYDPIPLPRLISMSDLIVVGSVTDVKDHTFTLQVSEYLTKDADLESVEVTKYIPPALFAPRSLPYKRGQRYVLFLDKPEKQDSHELWYILGFGGEGECPVEGNHAYIEHPRIQGLDKNTHVVHGVGREFQRVALLEFTDAIKSYPHCFSWKQHTYTKNKKARNRWVVEKTCSDDTLAKYRSKGWLHEYLTIQSMNRIAK